MLVWCQVSLDFWHHHIFTVLLLMLSATVSNNRVLNRHFIVEEHIIGRFNVIYSLSASVLEPDVVAAELIFLQLALSLLLRVFFLR